MQWILKKYNDIIIVNYLSDAVIYHSKGYKLTGVTYKDRLITDRKELEQYEREIIQSYF